MNRFERIKGELRPLLDPPRFSRDNLVAIEEACERYFLNAPALKPLSARTDAGIYLLRGLASDIAGLWNPDAPITADRVDALRDGPWSAYKRFALAVLDDPESDHLRLFQKTLSAILAFP